MDWPSIATSDTPLPEEPLVLEARDGDIATYQQCHDPHCPAKPGAEHAHLTKVQRSGWEEGVKDATFSIKGDDGLR